jgi:hypothetical protein
MMNPHIKKVYELYYLAFRKLIDFPQVKTPQENKEFVKLLHELVSGSTSLSVMIHYILKSSVDTVNIVELLGKGVLESYRRVPPEMLTIQTFLDQFLVPSPPPPP